MELINLAFSIDSILVAVAMSPKLWVVITGGILGIVAMRLVVGQLLGLVQRYPALVDGAFVIIAWVGIKLCWEYLHDAGFIPVGIPQWLSLGLIVVIFVASYCMPGRRGRSSRAPPARAPSTCWRMRAKPSRVTRWRRREVGPSESALLPGA